MTQGYYNSIMSKKGVENIMPKILREKKYRNSPSFDKRTVRKVSYRQQTNIIYIGDRVIELHYKSSISL